MTSDAQSDDRVKALEEAARLAERGCRCGTCGIIFDGELGHPEPECRYPDYYDLTPKEAASAIRALAPVHTPDTAQGGEDRKAIAWDVLCERLQRDPATSEESDTCTLRAAWKAMLAWGDRVENAAAPPPAMPSREVEPSIRKVATAFFRLRISQRYELARQFGAPLGADGGTSLETGKAFLQWVKTSGRLAEVSDAISLLTDARGEQA